MPGSYKAMSKSPHGELALQSMTGESEHTLPAHQILKKVIIGLPPRLKGYVS
jgi:hypothetical protein